MVLSPLVALDMPSEVGSSLTDEALRSCNLALGAGRCVARTDEPQSAWIAVLRFPDDDQLLLTIELRASVDGAVRGVRALEFRASDVVSHRWATAGVVVAALVVGEDSTASAAQPSPATQTPRKHPFSRTAPTTRTYGASESAALRMPRPTAARSAASRLSLDAALLAGPGFDEGPWRLGAKLRPTLAGRETPLLGWLSVSASRRAGTVAAAWCSGAMGTGLRSALGRLPLGFETRVGGVGTWLTVAAAEDQRHDQASRWRWGALGSLDVVVLTSPQLQTFAGVTATATWPKVAIEIGGELATTEPVLRWVSHAGVRWVP